ncbi:MAG: hypothetical protein HQK60_00600 [Deltaproteobacteria bacterium]|nr:hypothetical protein [Deltaproteobacteria bacterium]
MARINPENIYLLPILHGRMEFAVEVARVFKSYRPQAVAVEFPPTIQAQVMAGVARMPHLSVILYPDEGGHVFLFLEPTDGQVEALRLALEHQVPVTFMDRDTPGYPRYQEALPDSYAITRIGHEAYCRAYVEHAGSGPRDQADQLREAAMAYHLQALSQKYDRVLGVLGLYHYPEVTRLLQQPQAQPLGRRKREGVTLANLNAESSREIMSEIPFLAAGYEAMRRDIGISPDEADPDRLVLQGELLNQARERYAHNYKERITIPQLAALRQFARNYAIIQGQLTPDFYQHVIAARGGADDNFSYEVCDLGSTYPYQDKDSALPEVTLRGEDLYLNQKKIRFHRRIKTLRRRLVPVPVKQRPREKTPGEWKKNFNPDAICSYPPEDLVIEGYGGFLKKKSLKILSEKNFRVSPFSTSLHDGIDVRETIRNWAQGNIYVREYLPIKGRVGSVVVIFDEDSTESGQEKYPWCLTWLGENSQESDMAFYATPAGEQMVGPGLSLCHYGGFMLTYPPLRVYDIWRDPFFNPARSKPERLLLAAIDYSEENHVLYVAAKPPRSWCHNVANRVGKKIIYLPIGQLSPVILKKIRTFHVLAGHHVRGYAKNYIW